METDGRRALEIDPADGDEGYPRARRALVCGAEPVESHRGLVVRLGGRAENGTERDVRGALGERAVELLERVRRHADREIGPDATHLGERQIVLPDVHPGRPPEQRQVGTIVREQRCSRLLTDWRERAQKREGVASARRFGTELNERGPGLEDGAGKCEDVERTGLEAVEVEDRVEPAQLHSGQSVAQPEGGGARARDQRGFPRSARLCYVGPRMHARFAFFAGTALALGFAVHCTSSTKPAEVAPVSPPPDAATEAGEGGAGGAPEAAPERPRPDPALVQKALDRTGTPTTNDEAAHGLRFEVVEVGPSKTWAIAVINRGSEHMAVAFDPRLLTLEVEAPPDPHAKKWAKPPKPRVCRLPDELRPTRADSAYTIELAPGHGLVEAFDPRLYCMPQAGVSSFVAGARVSATLGWPVKTKTVWQHGKRVEEVLPQVPPFVARIQPAVADAGVEGAAEGTDAAAGDAGSEIVMTDTSEADAGHAPDQGVKELRATPFELGNDYSPAPTPPKPGLALEVTQGSDALSEAQATVTVRLANHGSTQADVYFRRELLSFEVSSVDGTEVCEPGPDDRAPDRQAFTHLAPGGSITVTSRLAEMCPKDLFARPGLYLVHGSFDGEVTGAQFGFDGFVGHLASDRAATVRIRTGELPFPGERALQEVQVGVAPTQ